MDQRHVAVAVAVKPYLRPAAGDADIRWKLDRGHARSPGDRLGPAHGEIDLFQGHGLRRVPHPPGLEIDVQDIEPAGALRFLPEALKLADQPAGALFGIVQEKRLLEARDGEKEHDPHQGHDHDELEQGETAPAAPDHSVSQLLMSLFSFSPPGTPSAP